MDFGVVDSPPPKQIFRSLLSLPPLKGVKYACDYDRDFPSQSRGNMTPHWQLCMDIQSTPDAPVPACDALAAHAASTYLDRPTSQGTL